MEIIELSGTPKSGKDSINRELRGHFGSLGILISEVKGGISKSPLNKKDSIEALIWSMCDLQLNYITHRIQDASYMLMNRGFFDRLVWIEQYLRLGTINASTAEKYADCWLEFALDRKNTTVFLFVTSPNDAMARDPRILNNSSHQSIMNRSFLDSFNESCLIALKKYQGFFKRIHIIDERSEPLPLSQKINTILHNIPEL